MDSMFCLGCSFLRLSSSILSPLSHPPSPFLPFSVYSPFFPSPTLPGLLSLNSQLLLSRLPSLTTPLFLLPLHLSLFPKPHPSFLPKSSVSPFSILMPLSPPSFFLPLFSLVPYALFLSPSLSFPL